jgi:hypothetical protein
MAAGLGYVEFATGDVLTAAAANGYLASQVVMVFASSAARTSAIASPQEGMISYLKDTNSTEYYSGSAWTAIGGGGASGFTFISRSTFSNVATVDIDNIFSNTYETYQIVIENIYGTNVSDDLAIQLRYAGPTTETAGYYGKTASLDVSYGVTNNNNASSVQALMDIRNTAGQSSSGSFFINNVGNASENPIGYLVGFSGGQLSVNTAGFYQITARTYTGLRFLGVGGNITGNISVYGLAKA